MVSQLCEYTKNFWIVPFQRVDFMVCELWLSEAATGLKTTQNTSKCYL